jgi:hypothetical protein
MRGGAAGRAASSAPVRGPVPRRYLACAGAVILFALSTPGTQVPVADMSEFEICRESKRGGDEAHPRLFAGSR